MGKTGSVVGQSVEAQDRIEQAAKEIARQGTAERIIYWDRRQSNPETAIYCGHDKKHGALTIHRDGATLICCARKQGAFCAYTQPVSV